MKLRNKKTGEIVNATDIDLYTDVVYLKISKDGRYDSREYDSLAEFNEEWEDYDEPKEYWFVDDRQGPYKSYDNDEWIDTERKEIGNYFETEEEAEKAVEKLKAWKRLKDKGFEFRCDIEYEGLCGNGFNIPLNAIMPPAAYTDTEVGKDLDLLFGGEE